MGIPLDLLFFLIQDAKFSFIEMKLWKKAENLSYNTTGPESARSQDDLKPFVFQDKLRARAPKTRRFTFDLGGPP
jgi:hypothetical protein